MPSPLHQPCFSAATSFNLIVRKEYSLDELKQKPAPDGVDPSRLEAYLNEADFQVEKKNIFFCLHFHILYQLVRYGSRFGGAQKHFRLNVLLFSLLCCSCSSCFWREVSGRVRKKSKGSSLESSRVRVLYQ